jgi:hypothetical protein
MTTHEDLIRKFSGAPVSAAPAVEPAARNRSKAKRRRLTVRLNVDVVSALQILKIALGTDMNRFCEEAVGKAAVERLAEVRAGLAPGEWDVIVRCADGSR